MKLDVAACLCDFGVFFCQLENFLICVSADDLTCRANHACHKERYVAATTTYIQALHSLPETDRFQ